MRHLESRACMVLAAALAIAACGEAPHANGVDPGPVSVTTAPPPTTTIAPPVPDPPPSLADVPAADPTAPPRIGPVPEGWQARVDVGVEYAVPSDWIAVPTTNEYMVARWQSSAPEIAYVAETVSLATIPNTGYAEVTALAADVVAQLRAGGSRTSARRIFDDPAGAQWAELEFVRPSLDGQGAVTSLMRLVILGPRYTLQLLCGGPTSSFRRLRATCREILDSVRLRS